MQGVVLHRVLEQPRARRVRGDRRPAGDDVHREAARAERLERPGGPCPRRQARELVGRVRALEEARERGLPERERSAEIEVLDVVDGQMAIVVPAQQIDEPLDRVREHVVEVDPDRAGAQSSTPALSAAPGVPSLRAVVRSSAACNARALSRVSSYSAPGSLSATTAPPTCR